MRHKHTVVAPTFLWFSNLAIPKKASSIYTAHWWLPPSRSLLTNIQRPTHSQSGSTATQICPHASESRSRQIPPSEWFVWDVFGLFRPPSLPNAQESGKARHSGSTINGLSRFLREREIPTNPRSRVWLHPNTRGVGGILPFSPLAHILFFSFRPPFIVNTNTDITCMFVAIYKLFICCCFFNPHFYVLTHYWDSVGSHRVGRLLS